MSTITVRPHYVRPNTYIRYYIFAPSHIMVDGVTDQLDTDLKYDLIIDRVDFRDAVRPAYEEEN